MQVEQRRRLNDPILYFNDVRLECVFLLNG